MEGLARKGSLDNTHTNDKVAEMLSIQSLGSIASNHGRQLRNDLGFRQGLLVQLVQSLTMVSSTKVNIVGAKGLADKGNLGNVGASTTVGASCHTDGDGVVPEADLFDGGLEELDERGEVTLGFCHSQGAGWEGDTGHGVEHGTGVVELVELVLLQQGLDMGLFRSLDVGDDQVLVGGQTELAVVDLGNLTKTGLVGLGGGILDTSVLDVAAVMPHLVLTLSPTVPISVIQELEGTSLLDGEGETGLEFGLEPLDATVVDGVLQTGVLAVHTVTEIALDEHDLLTGLDGLLGGDEADDIGDAGVGLLVTVGHTHASSDGHVETGKRAVLVGDGDEAQVMGVNIDIVVRRDRND